MNLKNVMKKSFVMLIIVSMMASSMPMVNYVEAATGSIVLGAPTAASVNAGKSLSYIVQYGNVSNITLKASDIKLNGFTANVLIASYGANKKEIVLANIQGTAGKKSISIAAGTAVDTDGKKVDGVGSSFSFTLNAIESDKVVPTISVGKPDKSTAKQGDSVSYLVEYYDNKGLSNISLSSSNITLNGFTANVSITNEGNNRRITLKNIKGTVGKKSIAIAAGTASDAAGNKTGPVTGTYSFTLEEAGDTVIPTISVGRPSKDNIFKGESVSYTVEYYDNIGLANITLSAKDITLNGFTADITVTNSGNNRIITLNNIQGTVGKKSISIAAGTASDAAGNKAGIVSNTYSFTLNEKEVEKPDPKPDPDTKPDTKPDDWVPNPNTGK